jgi:hypothetical protein
MNILFVMEHRVNAGNTHAIENYIRVGNELGHRWRFSVNLEATCLEQVSLQM